MIDHSQESAAVKSDRTHWLTVLSLIGVGDGGNQNWMSAVKTQFEAKKADA